MKKLYIKMLLLTSLFLFGCKNNQNINNEEQINVEENVVMKLFIDNNEVEVSWLNNNSVKELSNLCPLTINMHEYGGFEQTGLIGKTISSSDKRIDVIPGDIVLYNSNQISVFYNSSSWSYTKLGHINLSNSELKNLLDKDSVIFKLEI